MTSNSIFEKVFLAQKTFLFWDKAKDNFNQSNFDNVRPKSSRNIQRDI